MGSQAHSLGPQRQLLPHIHFIDLNPSTSLTATPYSASSADNAGCTVKSAAPRLPTPSATCASQHCADSWMAQQITGSRIANEDPVASDSSSLFFALYDVCYFWHGVTFAPPQKPGSPLQITISLSGIPVSVWPLSLHPSH